MDSFNNPKFCKSVSKLRRVQTFEAQTLVPIPLFGYTKNKLHTMTEWVALEKTKKKKAGGRGRGGGWVAGCKRKKHKKKTQQQQKTQERHISFPPVRRKSVAPAGNLEHISRQRAKCYDASVIFSPDPNKPCGFCGRVKHHVYLLTFVKKKKKKKIIFFLAHSDRKTTTTTKSHQHTSKSSSQPKNSCVVSFACEYYANKPLLIPCT